MRRTLPLGSLTRTSRIQFAGLGQGGVGHLAVGLVVVGVAHANLDAILVRLIGLNGQVEETDHAEIGRFHSWWGRPRVRAYRRPAFPGIAERIEPLLELARGRGGLGLLGSQGSQRLLDPREPGLKLVVGLLLLLSFSSPPLSGICLGARQVQAGDQQRLQLRIFLGLLVPDEGMTATSGCLALEDDQPQSSSILPSGL